MRSVLVSWMDGKPSDLRDFDAHHVACEQVKETTFLFMSKLGKNEKAFFPFLYCFHFLPFLLLRI